MEKYPRGSRGSPAKGVDRITLVRGFKSRLLRQHSKRYARVSTDKFPIGADYRVFFFIRKIGSSLVTKTNGLFSFEKSPYAKINS